MNWFDGSPRTRGGMPYDFSKSPLWNEFSPHSRGYALTRSVLA